MWVVLLATSCAAAAAPSPDNTHFGNAENLFNVVHHGTVYKENESLKMENNLDLKTYDASAVRTKPSHTGGVDPAPRSFDWRTHGVGTPVKDSYISCNPGHIFSAIGSIEGQYALKHNQCISLSEQQCIDCLPDIDCVNGGAPHEVMLNLARHGYGCVKMEDYPFVDNKQYACQEKSLAPVANVTNGLLLKLKDEDALAQALIKYGPLVVKMNFSVYFTYRHGILNCTGDIHNQALLLVGYGEGGQKFWVVKAVKGESYGEDGYVRLARGGGVCLDTSYVAVAEVA